MHRATPHDDARDADGRGQPLDEENDPRTHAYNSLTADELLLEIEDRSELAALMLAHGLVWGDMSLDECAHVALRHIELALIALDRVLPTDRAPGVRSWARRCKWSQ